MHLLCRKLNFPIRSKEIPGMKILYRKPQRSGIPDLVWIRTKVPKWSGKGPDFGLLARNNSLPQNSILKIGYHWEFWQNSEDIYQVGPLIPWALGIQVGRMSNFGEQAICGWYVDRASWACTPASNFGYFYVCINTELQTIWNVATIIKWFCFCGKNYLSHEWHFQFLWLYLHPWIALFLNGSPYSFSSVHHMMSDF